MAITLSLNKSISNLLPSFYQVNPRSIFRYLVVVLAAVEAAAVVDTEAVVDRAVEVVGDTVGMEAVEVDTVVAVEVFPS